MSPGVSLSRARHLLFQPSGLSCGYGDRPSLNPAGVLVARCPHLTCAFLGSPASSTMNFGSIRYDMLALPTGKQVSGRLRKTEKMGQRRDRGDRGDEEENRREIRRNNEEAAGGARATGILSGRRGSSVLALVKGQGRRERTAFETGLNMVCQARIAALAARRRLRYSRGRRGRCVVPVVLPRLESPSGCSSGLHKGSRWASKPAARNPQ